MNTIPREKFPLLFSARLRRTAARALFVALFSMSFALFAISVAPAQAEDWPGWGGPRRNFHADGPGLATVWPEAGPPRLWRRELGEGYAGLAVVAGRVLTQFRTGDTEFVAAFDAATGKDLWRLGHEEPATSFDDHFGLGPHATPAMEAGRVFAISSGGLVRAFDAATGQLLWRYPLWRAEGATRHGAGYTNSPLVYGGLLISPVGGDGDALVALRQADGAVAWRSGTFVNSYASPVIVPGPDGDQLVIFARAAVLGLDPLTGRQIWHMEHANPNGANITTPLWLGAGRIFVSSGPEKGSRVLQLSTQGTAKVEAVWNTSRFRVFYTNALTREDKIYGSTGGVGQALLAAADLATGEVLWRDRRVGRANLVQVGELTLALDDGGRLWLLRLGPTGVEVLAETQLFDSRSWTPPTVVNGRLYARDQTSLVALDLPRAPARSGSANSGMSR